MGLAIEFALIIIRCARLEFLTALRAFQASRVHHLALDLHFFCWINCFGTDSTFFATATEFRRHVRFVGYEQNELDKENGKMTSRRVGRTKMSPEIEDWTVTSFDPNSVDNNIRCYMGSSKNILNTTLKKMGRRHKIIVLSVLITIMLLACSSLDVSW